MKLSDLLLGIIDDQPLPEVVVGHLTANSREVKPGSVYCAYQGERFNGASFIGDAIQRGAVAIFCDAALQEASEHDGVPLIFISNLKARLSEIAARFYSYPSRSVSVIGITGTNGKTSTAYLITQALTNLGVKTGFIGTLGAGFLSALSETHFTTPDPITLQETLAQLRDQGAEVIAMEVSSHSIDQGRLVGVQFDTVVLTQLSRDHLDYHGTMSAYAATKKRLFTDFVWKNAVVNADDALGQEIMGGCADKNGNLFCYTQRAVNPGLGRAGGQVALQSLSATNQGFSLTLETPWGKGEFTTSLLGRFTIENLLAVITVLGARGIPFSAIQAAVKMLTAVPGRMQCLHFGGAPNVVIDYAHTPDALEKLLESVRAHCAGKIVCVFGCGGDRDVGKRPLMAEVGGRLSDQLILTADNPRLESQENIFEDMRKGLPAGYSAVFEPDRAKAITRALSNAKEGDWVVIAGKGHEEYQMIGETKYPFSDYNCVVNCLGKPL